jgi:hypothetical protein
MDSKRFDSLTRALARWSSRRRFLGGLSAAAIGGVLPHATRAAEEIKPIPEECGKPLDEVVRKAIVWLSSDRLQKMAPSSEFAGDPDLQNNVQFEDYVSRVRCLLSHGAHADEQQLDGDGVRFLISMADGLVSAGTVGAADFLVLVSDEETPIPDATATATPTSTPTGQPSPTTTPAPVGELGSCISQLTKEALQCKFNHLGDEIELYHCYVDFFLALIGGADEDSCLKQTAKTCHHRHDCCLRGCCPTFC